MIWMILLPAAILFSGPGPVSAVICAVVWLGICLFLTSRKDGLKPLSEIRYPNLSLSAALSGGICFYLRWNRVPLFASLENLPLFPAKRICGLASVLLALLSVFGIDLLISLLSGKIPFGSFLKTEQADMVTTGIFSASLITLVSSCSPLYAFNDWVDPHTMFTVGKGILGGMLPYRDIFEQKGPLILLLHALAARISWNDLTGVWILEIICCFFFLELSRRLLSIRFGRKALLWIPLTGLAVYTTLAFERGDSAEELCLPFLAYALLTGLRIVSREKDIPRRDWFLIGVTSGCVLWTKYSMLGFYPGWFLALFLFFREENRLRELRGGFLRILAGLGAVSLPILLFFTVRGGLADFFRVYFYENIFLYPKTMDVYGHNAIGRNLLNGMLNFLVFNTPAFLASAAGIIYAGKREDRAVFRYVLFAFLGLFLVSYFPGRFYTYYPLIFGAFVPFGLFPLSAGLKKLISRLGSRVPFGTAVTAAALCCLAAAFLCSGNLRMLAFEREDYPQYQAKALIEASGIEDPSLLNYRILDTGVNTAAGLKPSLRFFCDFNLPLEEIRAEQNACLESGCADFVITFMLEIDSPKYELLAELPSLYPIGPISSDYKLYRKSAP